MVTRFVLALGLAISVFGCGPSTPEGDPAQESDPTVDIPATAYPYLGLTPGAVRATIARTLSLSTATGGKL